MLARGERPGCDMGHTHAVFILGYLLGWLRVAFDEGEGMFSKEGHQTFGGLSCSRVLRAAQRRSVQLQPQDRLWRL